MRTGLPTRSSHLENNSRDLIKSIRHACLVDERRHETRAAFRHTSFKRPEAYLCEQLETSV